MIGPSTARPTGERPGFLPPWCRAALAMGVAIGGLGPAARAQSDRPRPESAGVGFVDRTRPCLPEGLAMVEEILAGGRLAPGRGWFEKGVSRTRFGWDDTAARYDRNKDGSIARSEYPGPLEDFRRLDRDRSGGLGRADFGFPANAVARSRSRMIMSFADRDKDGRFNRREYNEMVFMATRDEYTRHRYFSDAIDEVVAAFEQSERKGVPFLGLGDLRDTVDLAAARKTLEGIPNPDGDVEPASRSTLLWALIRRDIGSLHAGPRPGDPAPDFTLPSDDGKSSITLSKLLGSKPVVLVFGSYSEPTFRGEAGTLEKLYRIYRGRAEFLLVATRESRPSDGWASVENVRAGIAASQPKDDRGRLAAARDLRKKFGLGWPMAVDGMDDRVSILYSGLPDRIYLLDPRGVVAYQGGRGPFGFKPDELEQSLILLLQADSPPAADSTRPSGR